MTAAPLGSSLPALARSTLSRATLRWPAYVLAGTILVWPVVSQLPTRVRYAPFLVSVVVFGLPHGAVDHLVPARLAGVRRRRSYAVVGGVYAVLMAGYLLVWLVAPVVGFVSFILLTWYHWGQGDVYALAAIGGVESLSGRLDRWLSIIVRGGLPMLVPLLSHPDEYRAVATAIVSLFAADAGGALGVVFTADTRLVAGIAFAGVTIASLALGLYRVRQDRLGMHAWRRDVLEVGLLWAYFWVLSPIFAIGVYFAVWHAVRHIGRLAAIDDRSLTALSAGELRAPVGRFARDAAPLTAASLLVFVGLFVGLSVGIDPDSLLAVYLVGIALLTLPHVAVVTWMDRRQLGTGAG